MLIISKLIFEIQNSPLLYTHALRRKSICLFFFLLGIEAAYNTANQNESDKREIRYQE